MRNILRRLKVLLAMEIKVKFAAALDRRLVAGWALVTMGGRVLRRFSILRLQGYELQQSIDKATDHAVNAAIEVSNDNQIEFSRYDIDYSGLPAVENQAA